MPNKVPVRKSILLKGCESCQFKQRDFWNDVEFPQVIRCYCSARKVNVDAELMSRDCDFWRLSPEFTPKDKQDQNKYGL